MQFRRAKHPFHKFGSNKCLSCIHKHIHTLFQHSRDRFSFISSSECSARFSSFHFCCCRIFFPLTISSHIPVYLFLLSSSPHHWPFPLVPRLHSLVVVLVVHRWGSTGRLVKSSRRIPNSIYVSKGILYAERTRSTFSRKFITITLQFLEISFLGAFFCSSSRLLSDSSAVRARVYGQWMIRDGIYEHEYPIWESLKKRLRPFPEYRIRSSSL